MTKSSKIMWDDLRPGLTLVPEKVSGLITGFAKHFQDVILSFCPTTRKARRKDKEANAPGSDDPKLYLEEAVLERKFPDLDLRTLVELPKGLDYNEWLASHTIAFFDHINLIYGTISEFCTMSGCPDMTGPGLRTYLWFDDKGKKTKVAAPQYIDYVMTFTQKTINDESIFPTKYANEFPSSFESLVKKILRLLFHVVAHMYHNHFKEIILLNLHAHLNSVFAHLILFNERFRLIEDKEIEVLQDLVTALRINSSLSLVSPPPPLQPPPPPQSSTTTTEEQLPTQQHDDTSKENNNFLPVVDKPSSTIEDTVDDTTTPSVVINNKDTVLINTTIENQQQLTNDDVKDKNNDDDDDDDHVLRL